MNKNEHNIFYYIFAIIGFVVIVKFILTGELGVY